MEADVFLRAFDPLPEPALLLSPSGHVTAANRAAHKLLDNRSATPLAGAAFHDLVSDPVESVDRFLRLCRRSRQLIPGALTCRTAGGNQVACRVEGALMTPPDQASPAAVLIRVFPKEAAPSNFLLLNQRIEALHREVVQRQKTQAILDAEREWLRTTLASIGDAVIATDANGNVALMNNVAESLTGWSQADAVGQSLDNVFNIINEETRQPVTSPVNEVLTRRTIVGLANHTVLIAKDGTERPIADSGAPILDASGKIIGVVLVFRDVTESHLAQNRIAQSEKRFRRIFDTAPVAIWEQDFSDAAEELLAVQQSPDTFSVDAAFAERVVRKIHTVDVNEAALHLFQASDKAELLGSMTRVFTPEAYGVFAEALLAHLQGKSTWTSEVSLVTLRGKPLQVLFTISLPVGAQAPAGALVTLVDITDRKRAEEALHRANVALTCANRDLEHFAYAAAHDLQEPLRNVVLYTQILHRRYSNILDERGREACHIAIEGATRMQSLLEGLLEYTHVVSESDTESDLASRAELDCEQILSSVKQNLRAAIEQANARILCDELPPVNARGTHLIQLFQNLLSNAIKYRKPGEDPVIHITARQEDGNWIFLVEDNGVGIRPEYRDKIFEAFKRLHGREIPGVGMGLTICSRIVSHYGGKIWVESEEGRGSTFAFTMPQQKGR
jgi:PAS domain S-box-containing protein